MLCHFGLSPILNRIFSWKACSNALILTMEAISQTAEFQITVRDPSRHLWHHPAPTHPHVIPLSPPLTSAATTVDSTQ